MAAVSKAEKEERRGTGAQRETASHQRLGPSKGTTHSAGGSNAIPSGSRQHIWFVYVLIGFNSFSSSPCHSPESRSFFLLLICMGVVVSL